MTLRLALLGLALLVGSHTALAQSGLSGNGSSGLSGGGTTNFGTGTSTTGSSTTGSSRSSGTGTSGTQTGSTVGSNTLGSNATQSFIGGNQTQGFVGGARESSQMQNMNRQFQAIQNNQSQSSQQSTGTPRQIRAALSVGFAFPSATAPEMTGRLANANQPSLDRFAATRPELSGVSVVVNSQGVAVLTGSTATTESRRLAANLIRLQPGIRRVDNQLTVSN